LGIEHRMRNGVRSVLVLAVLAPWGRAADAAPGRRDGPEPIRLTVEVSWSGEGLPPLPGEGGPGPVEVEPSEGRVVEAVAWPPDPGVEPPGPSGGRAWRLGGAASGRARVRVEAPAGASLLVRAGGRLTRFPIVGLMEGPQQTLPGAPVEVRVERLPWDALELHLPEGDGTAAPGAQLPVALGFNILTPEPTEVAVRYSAELRPIRGGAPAWRFDGLPEVVPTDALNPRARVLNVPMPPTEGTYLLEVRASWEPAADLEGTRLGRWLRRRRNGPPVSAARRVTLAVLTPRPLASPSAGTAPAVVDAIDPGRRIGGRPSASGRASASGDAWAVPEEALVEPRLRDRLRGWIAPGGNDAASLLPPADASGLAWSALPLKVDEPGRPHRLTIRVAGGPPEALGVALVVPPSGGRRGRVLLDACAAGPPAADPGESATFEWPVWPDAADPVLVLVNRGRAGSVRIEAVELAELPGGPAPAALAETHPQAPRTLALRLGGPSGLDRFGGAVDDAPGDDVLATARNLAGYLAHLGASAAVLPAELARDRATRSALDGQAAEDALGPDRLDLTLRVLKRRGLTALLELDPTGPLPGLPAPGSAEASARGLVRVDGQGRVADDGPGPAYQPLNPEVRRALARGVSEAIAPRLAHPNLAGLVLRLGPGPTLPGGPADGLDDATYAAFIKAMFRPDDAEVPVPEPTDPGRFAVRARFVAGPGRTAWLDWRAERLGSLYAELATAARAAAPGAVLAVATPGLDAGPAGDEARRADRLGLIASEGWRAVGLDLGRWPEAAPGLVVLRGAEVSSDGLARDLATDPDLDAAVAARPSRGVSLGPTAPPPAPPGSLRLTAPPLADDEPLGHALAVLDPAWVVLDAEVAAGQEARVARFARVYRALPEPPGSSHPSPRLDFGVAVRSWSSGGRTYLVLANDTPFEVLQPAVLHAPAEADVDDLGRGLRLAPASAPGGGMSLVLRLPPFGAAAVRVAAPDVRVEPRETRLPEPAAAALEARAAGVSDRLGRLARGEGPAGPPSPGFEAAPPAAGPGSGAGGPPLAEIGADPAAARIEAAPGVGGDPPAGPGGWAASGDPANLVALDPERPHAGLGALRLDARALPASAECQPFPAPGGTELTVRAWLRADHPQGKVRVWIEGESGGRPLVRRADVPAGTDWAERAIRVPDLPADGLETVRLRFEWLGPAPASLWLDDVSVQGQGPSESGLRAQQVLAEALQAYRRKRYADFARLLGSHRARGAAPDAVRTGASTDLPPGRRLR
jgi:hypothetical protein